MPELIPPNQPLKATRPSMASWASQASQYPEVGPPGMSYFAGHVAGGVVHCLLWRSEAGQLVGILNYYPTDMGVSQRSGTLNLWVHPEWQRRGIGTRLGREAAARWELDLNKQDYTEAGVAITDRYLKTSTWGAADGQ